MNLLIIEDDKETLDFLKPSLKMEGFVVDTAEDGETGSYKAKTNDYDRIMKGIVADEPAYYVIKENFSLSDVVEKVKERLGRV